MDQTFRVMQAVQEGKIEIPEEARQMLAFFGNQQGMILPLKEADPEVSVWPGLAWSWMTLRGAV